MKSEGRCPGQNCGTGCSEVGTGCHGNTGAPAEDRCQWCVVWLSRGIRIWMLQVGNPQSVIVLLKLRLWMLQAGIPRVAQDEATGSPHFR